MPNLTSKFLLRQITSGNKYIQDARTTIEHIMYVDLKMFTKPTMQKTVEACEQRNIAYVIRQSFFLSNFTIMTRSVLLALSTCIIELLQDLASQDTSPVQ